MSFLFAGQWTTDAIAGNRRPWRRSPFLARPAQEQYEFRFATIV
jgi:hypothetical protein